MISLFRNLALCHLSSILLSRHVRIIATPFDFVSRTKPLANEVKNKLIMISLDVGCTRLSSFIACLARQVSNRDSGYNRGLYVFSVRAFQAGTRVTPKSFSSGYDSLLYAPRGPPSRVPCSEMPVEESSRSIRRRAPTLADRLALDDALSGADWGPLEPIGQEYFYISTCRP